MLESEFEREVSRVGRSWTEAPPLIAPPAPAQDASSPTPAPASTPAVQEKARPVGHGVELTEWEREGWTYHAKGQWAHDVLRPFVCAETDLPPFHSLCVFSGVWVSPTSSQPPLLTLIGSSNLSTRSATLDHETSFFITTTSPELRRSLANEVSLLRKFAEHHRVGEETWQRDDRKVSWQTKVLVKGLGVGKML